MLHIDVKALVRLYTESKNVLAWSNRDPDRYSFEVVVAAQQQCFTLEAVIPQLRQFLYFWDHNTCEWLLVGGEREERFSTPAAAMARLTTWINQLAGFAASSWEEYHKEGCTCSTAATPGGPTMLLGTDDCPVHGFGNATPREL